MRFTLWVFSFTLVFSFQVLAKKEKSKFLTVSEYQVEVENRILSARDSIAKCKKQSKPKRGKIVIAWEVDEKGKARNFTKGEDTVENEKLYHCIIKKIEKLKFSIPPLERALDVEHSFLF